MAILPQIDNSITNGLEPSQIQLPSKTYKINDNVITTKVEELEPTTIISDVPIEISGELGKPDASINIDSGKTNQISTTGKNILEPYNSSSTLNGITCVYDAKEQTYTFNGTCDTDNTYFQFANNEIVFSEGTSSATFWVSGSVTTYCTIRHFDTNFGQNNNYDIVTLSASNPVIAKTRTETSFISPAQKQTIRFNNGSVATNFKIKIMVTNSTNISLYEPYTGGQPAPSPSYPQGIVSIGSNVNLFDIEATPLVNPSTIRVRPNGNTLLKKGTYTISYKGCDQVSIHYYKDGQDITIPWATGNFTFTFDNDYEMRPFFRNNNDAVISKDDVKDVKIEPGLVPTSYSPYNRGSIEFKVRNKNIWGGFSAPYTRSVYGVTFVTNIDGTISAKGTASSATQSTTTSEAISNGIYSTLTPGTYTFSCLDVETRKAIQILDENNTLLGTITNASQPVTITLTETKKVYARVNIGGGNSVDKTFHIQVEKGSTATTYVEHKEQTITVPMPEGMELCKIGNYEDKFVKQNGKWYKYEAIGEFVYNGTENWGKSTTTAVDRFVDTHLKVQLWNVLDGRCNCLKYKYNISDNSIGYRIDYYQENSRVIMDYAAYGTYTLQQFKDLLTTKYNAGNPLKVKYVKMTPTYTEITDTDTIEALETLQSILLYPDYTLIECIDNITPYIKVEYYTNEDIAFVVVETDRIEGFTNGIDAIKQAIYHILMTERYAYLIYDNNYGVELQQYIGKDLDYIEATIEQTLKEALTYDLRITDVKVNSIKQIDHDKVLINFTAYTIYGDLVLEVNINV
jgi:phage baseplate assembly protein W